MLIPCCAHHSLRVSSLFLHSDTRCAHSISCCSALVLTSRVSILWPSPQQCVKECKRVQRNCFSLFCLSPIIADGFARINPPNYLTVTTARLRGSGRPLPPLSDRFELIAIFRIKAHIRRSRTIQSNQKPLLNEKRPKWHPGVDLPFWACIYATEPLPLTKAFQSDSNQGYRAEDRGTEP